MEGTASVCSYQQYIEELKHSLLRTSLELESAQMAAEEKKRRYEENVKQLVQLLKLAIQERDEAKFQLKMLLNNVTQIPQGIPSLLPESPLMMQSKGNSSMESDSLSPVESSLFDAATSPDLANMNTAISNSSSMVAPNQPFLQHFSAGSLIPSLIAGFDQASAMIDQLAERKPLPEKGKLLQAVIEAGPMLQTLMLAGPLPEWRNPPPVESIQIPPISINDSPDSGAFAHKPTMTSASLSRAASPHYLDGSGGMSQACSASTLNFCRESNSFLMKRPPLSNYLGDGFTNDPGRMIKRQKFQC